MLILLQGAICLDTLGSNWSPVLNIKSALISVQSLLSSPEPKDPQDAQVAHQLMHKPSEFKFKAREWAIMHADAPSKDTGEGSGGVDEAVLKEKRRAAAKQKEEK